MKQLTFEEQIELQARISMYTLLLDDILENSYSKDEIYMMIQRIRDSDGEGT